MIKIEHISRAYDDFLAVNDVSFTIEKGEIAGLLGHNGAGKTTIMKMISGYLEPDSGRIEVSGMDIAEKRVDVQHCIGYLPETLPIYPELSVADFLDYSARLKGHDHDEARDEIRRVVQATDIGSKLLAPIATLSRGYKQRVGVAQAILGNPKLLILDEPTNGLDPTQTQHMRELIMELAKDATVILSTHIMQEVDAICDRVLIMRSGQLAIDSRLADLRRSNQLVVNSDITLNKARDLLLSLDGVEDIAGDEANGLQISIDAQDRQDEISHQIAKTLLENNFSLYQLKPEQRDLESVFRDVTEQSQTEVPDAA